MLKKGLLISCLFLSCFCLSAQKRDNLKLTTEFGFPLATPSENLGLLFNIEPKLKVSEHLYMGLRIAIAINSQSFENQDSTQFIISNEFDHGFVSILPTLDYYWQKENLTPYLGLGIGPYSLANEIDIISRGRSNPEDDLFSLKVGYRLGILIRGGIELKKIRFGLEYNLVPKITMESPIENKKIGTVNSSYLGLTFGLRFGN